MLYRFAPPFCFWFINILLSFIKLKPLFTFSPKVFINNISCKPFSKFISSAILDRLASGAISVWGRVGEVSPPHLVMPLTVEPSKPRLCNDNRFLNLWTIDKPFRLDLLPGLPRYVHKDTFQSVMDDKSGYDHLLLSSRSRTFFGFQWGEWYFVSNTIPLCWKLSAYVYHSTGSLASHYFRSVGIPCSLYIDDRHIGQLMLPHSSVSSLPTVAMPRSDILLAKAAIFLVCYFLSSLGYCIGLSKSILTPRQQVPFLGFVSDSYLQAFTLIPAKRDKFLAFLRALLAKQTVELVTLQRLAGKCVSMSLAVPGARLFTNEINMAISKAYRSSRPVKLSPPLRAEIEHWLFLESWSGFLPWRSELHRHIQLCSDASSFAWGGVLGPGTVSISSSDYWPDSSFHYDIATKEALALANVLDSFASSISNSWVDVYVDSTALLSAWNKQGSRSRPFFNALKCIFAQVLSSNVFISLHHVPSSQNPADSPSRHLSDMDASLSPLIWTKVQRLFRGNFHKWLGFMSPLFVVLFVSTLMISTFVIARCVLIGARSSILSLPIHPKSTLNKLTHALISSPVLRCLRLMKNKNNRSSRSSNLSLALSRARKQSSLPRLGMCVVSLYGRTKLGKRKFTAMAVRI